MKNNTAIIFLGGSEKQNSCFWPTYHNCEPGIHHDIIFVHRNFQGVNKDNVFNKYGRIIYENKIDINGNDIPHKAFGAYRFYFNKYKHLYEYFAFISDDVFIKSDNWLLKAVTLLDHHERIGFVSPQIMNNLSGTKYFAPSHSRAPIWFAKTSTLGTIDWQFNDDHDGEMKLADQFLEKGFWGVQIGNKISFAYDCLENDGTAINSLFESKIFGTDHLTKKFTESETAHLDQILMEALDKGSDLDKYDIYSPFPFIGKKNIIRDLEPFHGLIYDKSVKIAEKYVEVEKKNFNINLMKLPKTSSIDKCVVFLHVATVGNYQDVVDELITAIQKSGLYDLLYGLFVGIVGNRPVNNLNLNKVKILYQNGDLSRFEFDTLKELRRFAVENPCYKILYIHTKGVSADKQYIEAITDWREYMTYFNVERYEDCLRNLNDYDTCGVDWRTEPVPHFSGNFWWSKSDYIRKLPKIEDITNPDANHVLSLRHNAEFWIGMNSSVKPKSLFDCGINQYKRHMQTFKRSEYENAGNEYLSKKLPRQELSTSSIKGKNLISELANTDSSTANTNSALEEPNSKYLLLFLPHLRTIESIKTAFLHFYAAFKNEKFPGRIIFAFSNDKNSDEFEEFIKPFSTIFDIHTGYFNGLSYLDKIKVVLTEYNNFEYLIKADEDIFISPDSWRKFIKHSPDVLEQDNSLATTVNLSTGIPSAFEFINLLFPKEKISLLYDMLKGINVPDCLWGTNYSNLNSYLDKNPEWDEDNYWNEVRKLKCVYKGIHPFRVNIKFQVYINQEIARLYNLFFNSISGSSFKPMQENRPYFCNSFFAIKLPTYQEIINDRSLSYDSFDEVPLNRYSQNTGKNILFLNNSLGIHSFYNTVYEQKHNGITGRQLEQRYIHQYYNCVEEHSDLYPHQNTKTGRWSFGIITNGKRDAWVNELIESIIAQNIPQYEIIVCGTYANPSGYPVRYIKFSENDDKGWLTKKKNIVAANATYENMCILHDRIRLAAGWYEGMRKFGDDWVIQYCGVFSPDGREKHNDALVATAINGKYVGCNLDHNDWDLTMWVDGAQIITKKALFLKYNLDEELFHREGEDVEWCRRVQRAGFKIKFNPYSVLFNVCEKKVNKNFDRNTMTAIAHPSKYTDVFKLCLISASDFGGCNERTIQEVLQAEETLQKLGHEKFADLSAKRRAFYAEQKYMFWNGLSLEAQGRYRQASDEYRRAINLGLDRWRIKFYLARSEYAKGNTQIAEEIKREVIRAHPQNELIRKLFAALQQTRKTKSQQHAQLLRKRIKQIDCSVSTDVNSSRIEAKWIERRNSIRQMILNDDLSNFLNWQPIVATMFHEAKIEELQFLQSLPDWDRWHRAIRESQIGNPKLYGPYLESSGNLIHHAYSLAQLEQKAECQVDQLAEIVEFGGGYGSMCRLAYQLGFKGRYIIYDLPELSALQEYFLSCVGFQRYISYGDVSDAPTRIVLISDMNKLSEQLNHKAADCAFIALWSMSEAPVEIRDRVFELVSRADYYLIAYQNQFGQINNIHYFRRLAKSKIDLAWESYPIAHLPDNHYLIGYKKSLPLTRPDNDESGTTCSSGLVNGVIFSKDRAMQLDVTIRSFLLNCKDLQNVNLKVIYKVSNNYHKESYNKLIREYKFIEFIEENDFRKQLLSNLKHFQYVLFLVDDNIFVKDFCLSEIIEALQKNSDTLGFSLRLGKNINYHYPSSSEQIIPSFINVGGRVLKYDWTGANGYFGYPLEVSSSIYRIHDILPLLTKLDFQNPNTLEAEIALSKDTFADSRKNLLCFPCSVAFCNPVNVVQDVFPDNRSGNKREYSSNNLARMYDDGHGIDINKFLNFIPSSCHQEVQFKFIKSNSYSSGLGYNSPAVSIYMAVYNSEKYLAKTLDSILNQTFKNYEIVVSDDGSEDGTIDILKSYKKNDGRIKIIELSHVGVVKARNEAIRNCSPNSKYLMNHDSDDISLPTKLERLVGYLETRPEIAVVGCFAEYFDDEGNSKGQPTIEWQPERIRETFDKLNSMIHSASLIRRDVFKRIGSYRKEYPVAQDYDFFARALLADFELANIPEVLHRIRLHPKSIGNTHASEVMEAADRIRENYRLHKREGRQLYKSRPTKSGSKPRDKLSILNTVEFYEPHIGGSEKVVQQLSEWLVKRGHEVTVATTKLAERTFKELNGVRIEEFNISGAFAKGFSGNDVDRYQQFLLNHQADVVFNYAAQQWATDLALGTLEQTSKRRINIIAPCGYSALSDNNTLQLPEFADYFNRVIPIYLPKYDAAVYHSKQYQDYEFAQNYGFNNSVIIPNGVCEEEFSQMPTFDFRMKYKIKTKYLGLCVANFFPGKGQDRVIECLRKMNRPDLTMVFIGRQGVLLNGLKAKARGLNVRFLVDVPREVTLAAYCQADIFLFGSDKECSPLVIIEAKASRTPFVSTDCGNVREWKGGVVCAPDKMPLYANKILNDEIIRKSLAEDGWKEWKENLTWEAVADRYEELYLQLRRNKSVSSTPSLVQIPQADGAQDVQKESEQQPEKNTAVLVFSKDRAMQLRATIESFLLHCKDSNNFDITVLYKTTSPLHKGQYEDLKKCFKNIDFIEERNFRQQTLQVIGASKYIVFMVDDNIYTCDFSIRDVVDSLKRETDAIGFSLRLGENTTYCYSLNTEQKRPQFERVTDSILKFNWTTAEHDYGYPLEVSSSIYRSQEMLGFLSGRCFSNPNLLESQLALNRQFRNNRSMLLCYRKSVTFCNPANIVQNVYEQNRSGVNVNYSSQRLAQIYQRGAVIDVSKYSGFVSNAAHQEVSFYFNQADDNAVGISVVIPCYNHSHHLPDAVESIINQTYKNWECVIVNDGSTDNTVEVTRQLIEKYPNHKIRLIDKPQNTGLADARNTAILAAANEWILPLDSDDMFEPTFMKKAVDIIQQEQNVDIVFANLQEFGASNKIWAPEEYSRSQVMVKNTMPYASLYRKHLWRKVGGYDNLLNVIVQPEDWNFWISCSKHNPVVRRISEPLFLYRVNPQSMYHKTIKGNLKLAWAFIATCHPDLFPASHLVRAWQEIATCPDDLYEKINKAIEKYPECGLAYFWRGLKKRCMGQIHEALEDYQVAAERAKEGDWQPSFALMMLQKNQDDLAGARDSLEKLLSIRPDFDWAQDLLSPVVGQQKILFYYDRIGNISETSPAGTVIAVLNIAKMLQKNPDIEVHITGDLVCHPERYESLKIIPLPKPNERAEFLANFDMVFFATHVRYFKGLTKPRGQIWVLWQHCWQAKDFVSLSHMSDFDIVICLSDLHRVSLHNDVIGDEKLMIIPNLINTDVYSPKDVSRNGHSIMYAGALHEHKCVHILIDAFRLVRRQISDAELHIYGDGSMWRGGDAYGDKLKGTKPEGTYFHGYANNKDMPEIYSRHSLLVLPSKLETFPMVTLESQACGCIPVAHNAGGTAATIADGCTGLIYSHNTPEKLAEAIIACLNRVDNNPSIRCKAVDFVRENFSTDIAGKYISKLWDRISIAREVNDIRTLLHDNDIQQADLKCGQLLQKHPNHPDVLLLRALIMNQQGNWLKANAQVDELLEKFPNHIRALNDFGLVAMEAGDIKKALSYFTKAYKFNPWNRDTITNCYAIMKTSGEYKKAQTLLFNYLANVGKDARVLNMLGEINALITHSDSAVDLVSQQLVNDKQSLCRRNSSSKPMVSIITPVYNGADYIGQAIESVLSQNYKNFELLIVDDGSTDNTKKVVLKYNDDRIKYIFKQNGGVSSARNHAIIRSRGQYIMPLDADDVMAPHFITLHLQEFDKHPQADLIYCDVLLIDADGEPIRIMKKPEYQNRKLLIRDLFRQGHPVIPFRFGIRRSVFDRIGLYDETLLVGEDYDMMRRFVKAGLKEHHLQETLHLRRMYLKNLSGSTNIDKARSHFEVVRRFTETFSYDELFPDVGWDKIAPETRKSHAKCLAAVTYLKIGQSYIKSNSSVCARTAFDLAHLELKDYLKVNPNNEFAQRLLQNTILLQTQCRQPTLQAIR